MSEVKPFWIVLENPANSEDDSRPYCYGIFDTQALAESTAEECFAEGEASPSDKLYVLELKSVVEISFVKKEAKHPTLKRGK